MMARDLSKVIDDMLAEIPETASDLRHALKGARSSAVFAAPENMHLHWRTTVEALNDYIGEPKTEWHFKVAKIFMGGSP